MKWIRVKDKEPPKDKRFLISSDRGVEMMEWRVNTVYGEDRSCFCFCSGTICCCCGGCSADFDYWMELPEPHKN